MSDPLSKAATATEIARAIAGGKVIDVFPYRRKDQADKEY